MKPKVTIAVGDGFRWTLVGLKEGGVGGVEQRPACFRWTLVGLKVVDDFLAALAALCFRWTLVGLKVES